MTRQAIDTKTGDLLPDHDLAGERPRMTKSQRTIEWRNKNNLKAITANLPGDLVDEFHKRRKARGQTVNEALEALFRTQYLRKR